MNKISNKQLVIILVTILLLAAAVLTFMLLRSPTRRLLLQRARQAAEFGEINYATVYNLDEVKKKDLRDAASQALTKGGKVFFNFDTLYSDVVVGRISVNPLLVDEKDNGTLNMTLDLSQDTVAHVRQKFEQLHSKPCAAFKCNTENFGMTVTLSARLDLAELPGKDLVAYHYDEATDTFSEIENAQCFVDNHDFVFVTTSLGGYVVVTTQ
ncbi:hypothetical protein LJC42_02355 [Eubacteriales bacterium OttesenSCG-928-K08]|nr:hypothetical protein [Eubacteriales bacterium OttesenSCG-928-K08]